MACKFSGAALSACCLQLLEDAATEAPVESGMASSVSARASGCACTVAAIDAPSTGADRLLCTAAKLLAAARLPNALKWLLGSLPMALAKLLLAIAAALPVEWISSCDMVLTDWGGLVAALDGNGA